ncbi:MAG: hypothetical protein ACRYFR_14115 [Janthinobacterium lividum]
MKNIEKKPGRPPKKITELRHIIKNVLITEAEQVILSRRVRQLKISEGAVFRLNLTGESVEEILLTRILDDLVAANDLRRQAKTTGTLDDETVTLLLKKAGAMVVSYLEQRHAR